MSDMARFLAVVAGFDDLQTGGGDEVRRVACRRDAIACAMSKTANDLFRPVRVDGEGTEAIVLLVIRVKRKKRHKKQHTICRVRAK